MEIFGTRCTIWANWQQRCTTFANVQVFSLIGSSDEHLQIGLDLLKVVKDDLGLTPPRKCLDFLLHACANAKDLDNARLIWGEYEAAGLPYNILNFLRWLMGLLQSFDSSPFPKFILKTWPLLSNYCRMYQVLLISGDHKAATTLLRKIPKDDPDVRLVIKACQSKYTKTVTTMKQLRTEKRSTSLSSE